MGIVNITPDSFSNDGILRSRREKNGDAVRKALQLIREGADLIDIGGESSRPGAQRVSCQEEIRRVIPTIQKLSRQTKIPISIDTYKTSVARRALDAGASIVNNIRGVHLEKPLLKQVYRHQAAIVLMHMRGTSPKTMQKKIFYDQNVICEIIKELKKSIDLCLEIGIKSDKIIIDPGIGFGKTAENNCEIINRLNELHCLGCPVLIGPSRKSFIGQFLEKDVTRRLLGSAASVCVSIVRGAHIVRVHDVKQMKEIARMTDAIMNHSNP